MLHDNRKQFEKWVTIGKGELHWASTFWSSNMGGGDSMPGIWKAYFSWSKEFQIKLPNILFTSEMSHSKHKMGCERHVDLKCLDHADKLRT